MIDVYPFVMPCLYLAAVSLFSDRHCPVWLHCAALAGGMAAQWWLVGGVSVLVGLTAGVAGFAVAVLLLTRMISSTAIYTICVGLAITPVTGWIGLGVGLLLAGIVGTVRTARVAGRDRVWWILHSTALAAGLTPGGLSRPNPGQLPTADDASLVLGDPDKVARMRLHLPPWLLTGLLAVTAFVMVS